MRLALVSIVLLGALACSDSSGPAPGQCGVHVHGRGRRKLQRIRRRRLLGTTGTSWAAGFVQTGETHVGASNPRSGGLVDLAILRLERTTPGSESIDPACNIDGSTSCTGMDFYLNFNGNGDTGDFFCSLTSGTIVLTEVTSSRAKGTFSGSGNCVDGTGGASEGFSVSNGAFDVALVAPPG